MRHSSSIAIALKFLRDSRYYKCLLQKGRATHAIELVSERWLFDQERRAHRVLLAGFHSEVDLGDFPCGASHAAAVRLQNRHEKGSSPSEGIVLSIRFEASASSSNQECSLRLARETFFAKQISTPLAPRCRVARLLCITGQRHRA